MSLIILTLILSFAAYYDLRYLKIPNLISASAIIIGLSLIFTGVSEVDFVTAILGFITLFVPLVIIWAIGTTLSFKIIGAGDVKLVSILPLFISLKSSVIIILISLLLFILFNIFKTNISKISNSFKDFVYFIYYGIPGPKDVSDYNRGPFAPFLLLSYLIFFFVTDFLTTL